MKRTKTTKKLVEKQKINAKTSKQLELEAKMAYCYGTEHYYNSPVLCYLYTDGVKTFAQEAGAYWFLSELNRFIYGQKEFCSLSLIVNKSKGDIYKDDKKVKHIPFTDCPDGEWKFFYEPQANVLMWNMEY